MSAIGSIRETVANFLRENVAAARHKGHALNRLVEAISPRITYFPQGTASAEYYTRLTSRSASHVYTPDTQATDAGLESAGNWADKFLANHPEYARHPNKLMTEVTTQMGKGHPEKALMLLRSQLATAQEEFRTTLLNEENGGRAPDKLPKALSTDGDIKLAEQCSKYWKDIASVLENPRTAEHVPEAVIADVNNAMALAYQHVVVKSNYPKSTD